MAFDFSKLSVLVVEDTVPLRQLVEHILDSMDVGSVYSAGDGETGYEKFKKYNPDIVLADWHMAPVNGIELTQQIRTDLMSPNRMTPVILVTGYCAIERVAEARDAGVTEFMVKPFSANDLATRLAYVINKPRDFIDCGGYFGPDRRRKVDPQYKGPFRREDDMQS
jgi:CheY-like chemotaxis protein